MSNQLSNDNLLIDRRLFSRHHVNRKWSELNRLGNSRLLRSSWIWLAVAPIAAKTLSGVDRIPVRFIGPDFYLSAELPFSWHIFFYSSLAFGLASLIYTVFCPSIVRRYSKVSVLYDSVESEEATQTKIVSSYCDALANRYRRYPDEIQGHLGEFIASFGKKNLTKKKFVTTEDDGYFRFHLSDMLLEPNSFADSFRAARNEADQTKASIRATCWYLYLVGFALLCVVIVENIYFVSSSFISYWDKGNAFLNYVSISAPIIIGAFLILMSLRKKHK